MPTVLVVDDDRFMRDLLAGVFASTGIETRTFASAAELLERADFSSRAVLLLDVQMPGMSGVELQLLLRDRGIDMPVIFLTGSSNIPIAVTAMRNGAFDFIEKPFDPGVLVDRVRRAFTRYDGPADPALVRSYTLRLASLTPREQVVLHAMVTGRTSKQIARELGGSFRTIETHRARVMIKMGAASLAELVRQSIEVGKPGPVSVAASIPPVLESRREDESGYA